MDSADERDGNASGEAMSEGKQEARELEAAWDDLQSRYSECPYCNSPWDKHAFDDCPYVALGELIAARQANQPQEKAQPESGLPREVGDKFVVANGEMRFLAQVIGRLDDVPPQRICQYCDSDKWSARYRSNQCPDTHPDGMWMHKTGNLTMPCNLQPPQGEAK
jgi:hypothetical protein